MRGLTKRWLRGLTGASGLVALSLLFAIAALVFVWNQSGSTAGSDAANASDVVATSAGRIPGLVLGDGARGPAHAAAQGGVAVAFRFTAVASGPASEAHVLVSGGSTARALYVGIYRDGAGRPAKLVASGSATDLASGGWVSVPLSPARISGGHSYWLAVLPTGGGLNYRVHRRSSCQALRSARGSLVSLPHSWRGHRAVNGCPISAYATAVNAAYLLSVAPTSSAAPSISGIASVGKTLTAAPGSWTGAPSSIAYQWQDCDSHGANCTAIAGATGATYVAALGDGGSRIRVLVSASNSHGSGSADSPATATVPAPTNCINNLGACGYPDPSAGNVGPGVGCSSLSASGGMTISTAGQTVQGMNITGQVIINAPNVTLSHDCIDASGSGASGSAAVIIEPGGKNALIESSDVFGANADSESVEEAIRTNHADMNTTADHDYIYNCGECIHGAAKLTNSYVDANASINEDHYEDIYDGGGGGPLIVEHNTMLNPHDQTAVVFASVDFGDQTTITIANNIMAGGDYVLYGGGSGGGGNVLGPVTVSGNRFSRKYFTTGGQYGLSDEFKESVTHWSGNLWDDTLAPVSKP
jgi:hypothetical protein